MHNGQDWEQEVSVYEARYENVIKEEAKNEGKRKIRGLEYRARHQFSNPLRISTHFYYTYTRSKSDIFYDFESGEWIDGIKELGDIATHKVTAGFYLPFRGSFGWYFNINYIGERNLYLRNPLRAQGREVDEYFTLDTAINYNWKNLRVTFKVKNLSDEAYFHPGPGSADSGNNFSQRSAGYNNSLVPQLGRSLSLNFRYSL